MDPKTLVENINMGSRVAEEETEKLSSYFVETETWRKTYNGDVDVILGPKGGGKSAIYSMLIARKGDLLKKGILLVPAEESSGTSVFADLKNNSSVSEKQLIELWKVYFLVVICGALDELGINNSHSKKLRSALISADLIPTKGTKEGLHQSLHRSLAYVKRLFSISHIETPTSLEPATGMVSINPKVHFTSPENTTESIERISVRDLYQEAQKSLEQADCKIWVALDRLDASFQQLPELEENALRALIQTYLDIKNNRNIKLKIFLRTDIWKIISRKGFREATHIKDIEIGWDPNSLLNLTVNRLLDNEILQEYYNLKKESVLRDIESQSEFFHRIFPTQVNRGKNQSTTFKWCLTRTEDGNGNAPRELIHLLNEVRDKQIRRFETGKSTPDREELFDREIFKEALVEVSKTRTERTLYSENSDLKKYIEAFRNQKALQSIEDMGNLWKLDAEHAQEKADRLVEVGFLRRKKNKQFEIPFLYRDYLNIKQGKQKKQV